MHGTQNFNVDTELKDATRYAVNLAGGPTRVAAESDCRLDAGTISRSYNWECSNYLPADVIAVVERLSGKPIISGLLFRRAMSRTSRAAVDLSCIRIQTAKIANESGEVVHETILSAEDGKLTPNEVKRIDRERLELASAVSGLGEMIHGELVAK
jgi:hypothetical protein